MNLRPIERIQTLLEDAACALLAGAVAFAVEKLLGGTVGQPLRVLAAAGAAAIAYVVGARLLVGRPIERGLFPLPEFQTPELRLVPPEELVLTDAERLKPPPNASELEPLVLDDILAELGPDSRVVRLFDRRAMPTPGHLKSRIDDHLRRGSSSSPPPDASQALSDALAELRRSLR